MLKGSCCCCCCCCCCCWACARGSELISIALLLAFALGRLDADLLVILLQGGQVLASLRELALFHALADIPMDEGALAVHQIELMVDAGEHLCNGSGIADHAASAHDLCKVTAWNHCWRLVIDAALEACGAPIHKLDGSLGLDRRHSRVYILGHHVASVHHAARHVLPVPRVAL